MADQCNIQATNSTSTTTTTNTTTTDQLKPPKAGANIERTINPKVVIVFSGKRKSGKDYIANLLQKQLQNYVVIRIAGPIKKQFALKHNLDYEEMLSESAYKEKHRLAMVTWSTEVRRTDQNYFLRISIEENNGKDFPIWILTDARRGGDIEFFEEQQFSGIDYIKIRVTASDECRKKRGFQFTDSIDNAETECGLDDYKAWTLQICNEDLNEQQILEQLKPVIDLCRPHFNTTN